MFCHHTMCVYTVMILLNLMPAQIYVTVFRSCYLVSQKISFSVFDSQAVFGQELSKKIDEVLLVLLVTQEHVFLHFKRSIRTELYICTLFPLLRLK